MEDNKSNKFEFNGNAVKKTAVDAIRKISKGVQKTSDGMYAEQPLNKYYVEVLRIAREEIGNVELETQEDIKEFSEIVINFVKQLQEGIDNISTDRILARNSSASKLMEDIVGATWLESIKTFIFDPKVRRKTLAEKEAEQANELEIEKTKQKLVEDVSEQAKNLKG